MSQFNRKQKTVDPKLKNAWEEWQGTGRQQRVGAKTVFFAGGTRHGR